VDPYRHHLRARRAEDPAVPVLRLLAEIREQGYTGSMNLLYHYITQGRVEVGRLHLSPRRVTWLLPTRLLLTRPDALSDSQQALLGKLTDAQPGDDQPCQPGPRLRRPAPSRSRQRARLSEWSQGARACDLPHLHAFTRGLRERPTLGSVSLPVVTFRKPSRMR
jgi:hypothetical protein